MDQKHAILYLVQRASNGLLDLAQTVHEVIQQRCCIDYLCWRDHTINPADTTDKSAHYNVALHNSPIRFTLRAWNLLAFDRLTEIKFNK